MSSKLAFILSFGFIVLMFCFSGDLLAVQIIHSDLEAIAVTVGHEISFAGTLTQNIVDSVQKDGKTFIVSHSEDGVKMGEAYHYEIYRYYDPLFMDSKPLCISIKRSAVIGYF